MEHTKVVIDKLTGGEDYHTWSFAMKSLLEMLGLEEAIADPCNLDVTKDKERVILQKAKNILILNVHAGLYSHIEPCKSASEIWLKLRSMYEDSGI